MGKLQRSGDSARVSRKLSKFTTSKTKVLLGGCWSGDCENGGNTLADKLSMSLGGSTVYAGASVADTRSLFASGNFSSKHTADFNFGANSETQLNTGVWYKSSGGRGGYINGYTRIGNAGKIIEKFKPFMNYSTARRFNERMIKLPPRSEHSIRIVVPTFEDPGVPDGNH